MKYWYLFLAARACPMKHFSTLRHTFLFDTRLHRWLYIYGCMFSQATDSVVKIYCITQLAAWNANRANKVFSICSWTEHLECSSAWFPSWTFLNHETVQHTKNSTIQRGLKGESSSTLTHKYTLWCMFFRVSQELKRSPHRAIFVAVYTFLNLCGLDTTSHCSISLSASSPREAVWLSAKEYSWLFWKKYIFSVCVFKQEWLKCWGTIIWGKMFYCVTAKFWSSNVFWYWIGCVNCCHT